MVCRAVAEPGHDGASEAQGEVLGWRPTRGAEPDATRRAWSPLTAGEGRRDFELVHRCRQEFPAFVVPGARVSVRGTVPRLEPEDHPGAHPGRTAEVRMDSRVKPVEASDRQESTNASVC